MPLDHTPYFPINIAEYAPWVAKHGLLQPYGKCQCGCGNSAPIASRTNKKFGQIKGQPTRYVNGHNHRQTSALPTSLQGQKTCYKCLAIKPLLDFTKSSSRKDGYHDWCKECLSAYKRKYRSDPSKKLKLQAQRRKHKRYYKRKGSTYPTTAKWYKNNPGARTAHQNVHKAVKDGELPKASELLCANCGNKAIHYHHHRGYDVDHQLDVIALCGICHRDAHSISQK